MIFSKYRISVLALLPVALTEAGDIFLEPGRVINGLGAVSGANLPRSFIPSKRSDTNTFQLRSFTPFQEPKHPLPRWIPRDIKNLYARQSIATESRQVCVPNGPSCGNNAFCFNGLGCCRSGQTGCNKDSCCGQTESCCSGGGCCPNGYNCVEVDGRPGCCLDGSDCNQTGDIVYTIEGTATQDNEGLCVNRGFGICPSREFCCPNGRKCLRDINGRAACERICENEGFFVCPSNDFCCPDSAQCFVDESGRSRCRVTVVTTITSNSQTSTTRTARPPSTRSSSSSEVQTSSIASSEAETTTANPTTSSDPPPPESSLAAESPTDAPPEPTVTGDPAAGDDDVEQIIDPLPSPNGGLDNIFTDPDNGRSIAGKNYAIPTLVAALVGLATVFVGWL